MVTPITHAAVSRSCAAPRRSPPRKVSSSGTSLILCGVGANVEHPPQTAGRGTNAAFEYIGA